MARDLHPDIAAAVYDAVRTAQEAEKRAADAGTTTAVLGRNQRKLETELQRVAARQREISKNQHDISARAGGDQQLQRAVARVLAGALRDAGAQDSAIVANALSPFVVQSIRREIENSRDDIVDALYPILGSMVRRYVQASMVDLNRKVEDSLPFNRWITAASGFFRGRGGAQKIAVGKAFRILETYVIDRRSGELLAHQQVESAANAAGGADNELVGGVLSAITQFCDDAFRTGGQNDLQELHLSDGRVLLRSSATRILAVHVEGTPPDGFSQRVDMLLERMLAEHYKDNDASRPLALDDHIFSPGSVIGPLEEAARPKSSPLHYLLVAAVLLGTCFGLWRWSQNTHRDYWLTHIHSTVEKTDNLTGYVVNTQYDSKMKAIRVSGIVGSEEDILVLKKQISGLNPEMDMTYVLHTLSQRGGASE